MGFRTSFHERNALYLAKYPFNEPAEVGFSCLGHLVHLLVGGTRALHPAGHVAHERDAEHTKAHMARGDDLLAYGHGHGVGAPRAEHPNLRWRLEGGAEQAQVHALLHGNGQRLGGLPGQLAQGRVVGIQHREEPRGHGVGLGARDGVAAREIQLVGHDAEIASLLKIEKEAAAEMKSNFSYQVEEVTRFVEGELTQEIFDQVCGKDVVKTEEEFRAKVKEVIANQFVADSDYKFLIDARKMLMEKVGKLEFPDALLKRIMRMNNQDKDEKFVDDNYDKSIEELTWHLIKEQLVKANDIKVEQEDVVNMAKEATRAQFAQYGMMSVPEDLLENYAKEMLKKKESVEGLVNRVVETKLASALKSQVKLNNKTISAEEFNKMFE